jgi:hypothetical protein
MRFVSTVVHGALDYVVGLSVIGLPFYFGLIPADALRSLRWARLWSSTAL